MPCPSFLCTGFQKCGTTTLYEILRQHPDVALCRDVKEPMYYRIPVISRIGNRRYYEKRYFGHIGPDDRHVLGEVNAGLNFDACADKIGRDFPQETKLLFLMRNPADRTYSAYKYFLARGFLPGHAVKNDIRLGHAAGFDRYVHEVLDNPRTRRAVMKHRFHYLVFSQSNYAYCIREYLDRFPKENMEFVFFEEFVKDQHQSCREIYQFLGLSDSDEIDYDRRFNETTERARSAMHSHLLLIAKGGRYAFLEIMAMDYWFPAFARRYRKWYDKVRDKCILEDTDHSKMLPETRAYLEQYFEEGVRDLERITGRNLKELWF